MPDSLRLPPLFPLQPEHEGSVRRLARAASAVEPSLGLGTLAAFEGLREVLAWACQGQSADETASVWLQNFRWARLLGLKPADDAPVPPPAEWEALVLRDESRFRPTLEDIDDVTAQALVSGTMQYPARHDFPQAQSAAFLPRVTPLALFPQDSAPHLGQLAANLTALTHGSPEALASGVSWVFLVRFCRAEAHVPGETIGQRLGRTVQGLLDFFPPEDLPQVDPPRGLRHQYSTTGSSPRGLQSIFSAAPATVRVLREQVSRPGTVLEDTPACAAAMARALGAVSRVDDRSESSGVTACLELVLRAALDHDGGPCLPEPAFPGALRATLDQWNATMREWDSLLPPAS